MAPGLADVADGRRREGQAPAGDGAIMAPRELRGTHNGVLAPSSLHALTQRIARWTLTGARPAWTLPSVHLADLLVAMAIFGVVSAAMLTVLQEGLLVYTVGASRVESQQSGRIAVERLAGEIRTAGLGPRPAFAAISVAESTHIVLHRDLDGDGAIAGPGETITWGLAGKTLRRDAGGGAQPVIDGVRRLALEYLDASGASTRVPDEVRTVVITLTTEAAWDLADRSVVTTFSTRVRLRNR